MTVALFLAPNYDVGHVRIGLLVATIGFAIHALSAERELRRARHLAAELRVLRNEKAELEGREASARNALEHSTQQRNDFMAAITHELKTPLTSLMGYASILRRRSDVISPQQRAEFFDIMDRQGHRVLRMIEDLLQSSKLSAGVTSIKREPLPLQAVIMRTVETFASMLSGHGLQVDMPEADLGLFGDPTAIEHVLTNLIDNAIKHAPRSSAIRLAVVEEGAEVHVSVSNDGPAIPAGELDHIFDRFRQADGAARDRRSVGLGLYIVRTLLTQHGGRIWVSSEPSTGTVFTFALPRRDPSSR